MKKLFAAITPAVGFLTLASSAFAENLCPTDGPAAKLCGATITTIVGPLISLLFVFAIIAALIFLVFGGFKWLTSGGDKGKVGEAREHVIAAIIGLVVIFLSFFLLNIALTFFGYKLTELVIPTIGG